MAITVWSGALQGVDAVPIRVEVDLIRRLPRVSVVGLAAGAVKESADRVRSAITSVGLDFPRQRIVINLAPADLRKDGTAFDLPMAVGVLAADGQVPEDEAAGPLWVGELGLGGELRPVRGALSLALLARELDRTLVLPASSATQAGLVPGARVLAAHDLQEVVAWLRGEGTLPAPPPAGAWREHLPVDLAEVRGQAEARLALEVAAAGAHHLLMMGPPGCGKSMLARRLPTILPELDFEEALDCTRVHTAAGLLGEDPGLMRSRPFRAPHHSVSAAGLIGGRDLRPGEVSLAHNGVLFLDEAPEFHRHVLEHLREPLQDGVVRVTRADGSSTYPAQITLVLAANPCPCGGHNGCRCTENERRLYQRRLSGPILDRVDLRLTLRPIDSHTMLSEAPSPSSAEVRARVMAARARQRARGQTAPNGRLEPGELEAFVRLRPDARRLLREGAERFHLTGRAMHRVMKVARTLADLAGQEDTNDAAIASALAWRGDVTEPHPHDP